MNPELRYVHDEIADLVGRSQSQVAILDAQGALLDPFAPMLHFPQFGVSALSFLRTLDMQATLDKKCAKLNFDSGRCLGSRFELYAHEIMAEAFGLSPGIIALQLSLFLMTY